MPREAAERGRLSWVQEGRLRRDAETRIRNCATVFSLPTAVTAAVLRERLAAIVAREDVLRVTEVGLDDGGYAVYERRVALPVRHVRTCSPAEVNGVVDEMVHRAFDRHHGPLWELAVIEHADGRRRPTAFAVFDHLVGDRRSSRLFRDEMLTGTRPAGPGGRYPDFVASQRSEFPDDPDAPTAAREFWLRHLDGADPDSGPALPFGGGAGSGTVRTALSPVAVPPETLRATAAATRASPFLLFLAAVVSASAETTGVDDVTVRVGVTGRPREYRDTLGWFADCVPVRVRDGGLAHPPRALSATRAAWLATLRFQTTPWDYIRAVCRSTTRTGPPPLDVNLYLDRNVDAGPGAKGASPSYTEPGHIAGLELDVAIADDGGWHLGCRSDPARFAVDGTDAFVALVLERLARLVEGG